MLEVWLRNKASSQHIISSFVPVATATYMIPVADKDVHLRVDHCEVIVLEGLVLLINVLDFQSLKNRFQESKISRRSQQKFRSRASCVCVKPSPHKTMRIGSIHGTKKLRSSTISQ